MSKPLVEFCGRFTYDIELINMPAKKSDFLGSVEDLPRLLRYLFDMHEQKDLLEFTQSEPNNAQTITILSILAPMTRWMIKDPYELATNSAMICANQTMSTA